MNYLSIFFFIIFSTTIAHADGDQDIRDTGSGLPLVYECDSLNSQVHLKLFRGGWMDMTLVKLTRNSADEVPSREVHVPRALSQDPKILNPPLVFTKEGFGLTIFTKPNSKLEESLDAVLVTSQFGSEFLKCIHYK